MKLIVKSPVWDDLREIGLRISKDNPEAAERFSQQLGRLLNFSNAIRESAACAPFLLLECVRG